MRRPRYGSVTTHWPSARRTDHAQCGATRSSRPDNSRPWADRPDDSRPRPDRPDDSRPRADTPTPSNLSAALLGRPCARPLRQPFSLGPAPAAFSAGLSTAFSRAPPPATPLAHPRLLLAGPSARISLGLSACISLGLSARISPGLSARISPGLSARPSGELDANRFPAAAATAASTTRTPQAARCRRLACKTQQLPPARHGSIPSPDRDAAAGTTRTPPAATRGSLRRPCAGPVPSGRRRRRCHLAASWLLHLFTIDERRLPPP
ncbi:hypothetical protein BC793_11013 [Actinoplanes xinjiangensis]|uniref:Uncharacterized protein n=1 Tax=Actinoplanes xinjiangensis TaxID=512350 RepID=A0A316FEF0_9ACTN|nr:hypothetical protein BC793_11013 [Actinoplanes xinjiangensis]